MIPVVGGAVLIQPAAAVMNSPLIPSSILAVAFDGRGHQPVEGFVGPFRRQCHRDTDDAEDGRDVLDADLDVRTGPVVGARDPLVLPRAQASADDLLLGLRLSQPVLLKDFVR